MRSGVCRTVLSLHVLNRTGVKASKRTRLFYSKSLKLPTQNLHLRAGALGPLGLSRFRLGGLRARLGQPNAQAQQHASAGFREESFFVPCCWKEGSGQFFRGGGAVHLGRPVVQPEVADVQDFRRKMCRFSLWCPSCLHAIPSTLISNSLLSEHEPCCPLQTYSLVAS